MSALLKAAAATNSTIIPTHPPPASLESLIQPISQATLEVSEEVQRTHPAKELSSLEDYIKHYIELSKRY